MSLTAAELKAVYAVDEGPLDESISGLPGKIRAGAAALMGAGLLIGTALAGSIFGAIETESANGRLIGQLGLSSDEFERVGGAVGSLFAQGYSDNLGEINDAAANVVGSIEGIRDASSDVLEEATRDAINFAEVFDVDVAAATTSAGILIRNGLATDASEAFDLMVQAAQEAGPAMVDPVLEAANEYGVNFAAMGYSGEQAMALLVDASANGEIALDKTGDAIKELGIRATDGSKTTSDAFNAIGLDTEAMAQAFLAGGDEAQGALQDLVGGLQDMEDPLARSQAAVALFGTPVEDLSNTQLPAFLDALSGAGGELENVAGSADELNDSVRGNEERIQGFINTAKSAFVDLIGGQVLPIVSEATSWLADNLGPAIQNVSGFLTDDLGPALQQAAEWIQANQDPILIITGLIAAVFIPHLVALATASTVNAAKVVVAWVVTQAGAIAAAAVHSAQVVAMIGGWVLMGAQSLIQGARMAAAWVLAMGPVGWVIAAVVGLVALIVANWDTVVSWTSTAWNAVTGTISGAWNAITGWVRNAAGAVTGAVSGAWNSVTSWTSSAWNSVTSTVSGAWNTVRSAVSSGISAAVDLVTGLPGRVMSALGNLGSLLYNQGRNMIQGLINGAGSLLSNIGRFFLNMVPSWIRGPFESALGIASPSKVFHTYGEFIGQGLVNGMADMQPAVAAQMQALANTTSLAALLPAGIQRVQLGDVTDALWDRLLAEGWRGRAGDNAEALYRPTQPTGASPTTGAGGGPLVSIDKFYATPTQSPASVAGELAVLARTGRT